LTSTPLQNVVGEIVAAAQQGLPGIQFWLQSTLAAWIITVNCDD
jgi:hypothetical protein